jgi:hypothetical protein
MGLFGLVLLMFLVIAAVVVGTLLLMPGWKSTLALFTVYAAGLLYVSLSPQLIEGQIERAALGLAWLALVLAGIVQVVRLLKRHSSR